MPLALAYDVLAVCTHSSLGENTCLTSVRVIRMQHVVSVDQIVSIVSLHMDGDTGCKQWCG